MKPPLYVPRSLHREVPEMIQEGTSSTVADSHILAAGGEVEARHMAERCAGCWPVREDSERWEVNLWVGSNEALYEYSSRMTRTMRIWSFLVLLATASNCESWLNFMLVIDVVRFPMDFRGFGRSNPKEDVASEPYTFTTPCRDLTKTRKIKSENVRNHRNAPNA